MWKSTGIMVMGFRGVTRDIPRIIIINPHPIIVASQQPLRQRLMLDFEIGLIRFLADSLDIL